MTTKNYDENKKDVYEQVWKVCAALEKIRNDIDNLKKSVGVYYDEAFDFMKETENEEKYTEEEYLTAVDTYDDWDALFSTIIDWQDIVGDALDHLNEIG